MGHQLALPFDAAPVRSTRLKVQVLESAPRPALSGPLTSPDSSTAEPPPRSRRREIQQRLAELLQQPVRVIMHDNRSVMLTGARREGALVVRMHHMFLDADEVVLRAVARFADRPDRRSRRLVDEYIEKHGHLISAEPRAREAVRAQGKHHDLEQILQVLNRDYFDDRVQAKIGFGEAGHPRGRRRRAIKLGSYDDSARRITVHPALDQARVPRVFVEYIVFHEMLHQVHPPERRGSRVQFHGAVFRQAERRFAGRREALQWYRAHDDLILRYRGQRRARRPEV
ncbi:MAG: hypothetical protein ABIJ09_13600 [Pseudomonadota bacterium]